MNHPVIQSAAKEPVNHPVILSVSEGSRMATLCVLVTGFFVTAFFGMTEEN